MSFEQNGFTQSEANMNFYLILLDRMVRSTHVIIPQKLQKKKKKLKSGNSQAIRKRKGKKCKKE